MRYTNINNRQYWIFVALISVFIKVPRSHDGAFLIDLRENRPQSWTNNLKIQILYLGNITLQQIKLSFRHFQFANHFYEFSFGDKPFMIAYLGVRQTLFIYWIHSCIDMRRYMVHLYRDCSIRKFLKCTF